MYIKESSIEEIKKCKHTIEIGLSGDDILALFKGECVSINSGFIAELVVFHQT